MTPQLLLHAARELAESSPTWADLSNARFAPETGLVSRAYPTREERAAFMETQVYRAIRVLVDAARDRTGLVEGATPARSG